MNCTVQVPPWVASLSPKSEAVRCFAFGDGDERDIRNKAPVCVGKRTAFWKGTVVSGKGTCHFPETHARSDSPTANIV